MIRRRAHRATIAGCREVARFLQSYLDDHLDEVNARRVANHLEQCRRCGLEAETYRTIKEALARRTATVDRLAIERLRTFAAQLMEAPPAVGGPAG